MTQTYRTDDLAKWGSGKGSNLEPEEFDINFWDLIQRMIAQEARPDPSAGIDHFSISGTSLYVHMTDATVLGPYVLPYAVFNARGEWAVSTAYSVLDTFTINGGLYVTIYDHVSDATSFDPGANDGMGNDYYALMIQTPGSALPTGGAVGQVVEKSTTSDFAVTWGWKLPIDGTTRQYLIKQSNTNQDAEWDTPTASDIEFVPATSSVLTSDNLADVIEELSSGGAITAAGVSYTPSTGSTLTDDNVQDALDTLGAGSALGRQTMWIPASAMTSRTTDGPASGSMETTTNKNMVTTLDFDSSTREYAQFDVAMPKGWDEGSVFYKIFWSHLSTTVNFDVVFGLDVAVVIDGGALDSVFSGTITVTDTGGTTDDLYVSDESLALVTSGVAGALCNFRISRLPSDGSDTMAVDARLHGIQLYYTVDAGSDD